MLGRSAQPKHLAILDQFSSFGKLVSDDRSVGEAFVAGVFALAVVAGKGDDKSTMKAFDQLYRSSSVSTGLLRTGVRLSLALDAVSSDVQRIHDFLRTRLEAGWDSCAEGAAASPLDHEIAGAMVSEGIFRDYLINPQLRPHIRAIAAATHNVLKETDTWRKGRQALAGTTIAQLSPSVLSRLPALRDYAAMVLMAVRLTTDRMISVPGEDLVDSSAGGRSYSGPTAWAMTGIKVLFVRDFLGGGEASEDPKTLHLAGQLLDNFKSSAHYLTSSRQSFVPTFLSARYDREAMKIAEELVLQQSKLVSNLEATEILDALPAPDEATTAYLHAPPAYFVRYYDLRDQGSLQASALWMTNSIIQSLVPMRSHGPVSLDHLPLLEDPSSKWLMWGFSMDGQLRSSLHKRAVPWEAHDLGVSEQAYAEISHKLEERSTRQVRQLGTVWERFPGVYSARLEVEPGLVIFDGGDEIAFVVSRADKDALRGAVSRTTRDWPAGSFEIEEEDEPQSPFSLKVTRKAAAAAAPVTAEALQSRRAEAEAEVSREFVASYCPQFRDLVRILRPFDVTLESGKGSHEKLMREGYMTVVSKNQRDCTLLLNVAVVLQILGRLHINEGDFVRRTRKEPPLPDSGGAEGL